MPKFRSWVRGPNSAATQRKRELYERDPHTFVSPDNFGNWQANADAQADFHLRAQHKFLDIPEDDMGDINVRNGIGFKELLALGAVVGVPTGGLGLAALGGVLLWSHLQHESEPSAAAPPPPAASEPHAHEDRDTQYRLRFVDPK